MTSMHACSRSTWGATSRAIPSIVPQNMPGAGSLRVANLLYNAAPKDGLTIGMIGRGMAMEPLIGASQPQYDARKFTWLGSRQRPGQPVRHLAHVAGEELERHARDTVHGRRRRLGLRSRHVRHDDPQPVRREGPPRFRLSGRHRDQSRDGARRGRRPLRLVVVEHQDHQARLGQRQEDQPRAADGAAEEPRACRTCR